MLRSPPSPLSVCFRSACWYDIGVVQFETEIVLESQTTLQALVFFLNVLVTDTTFDFLLLISVCNFVLWLR